MVIIKIKIISSSITSLQRYLATTHSVLGELKGWQRVRNTVETSSEPHMPAGPFLVGGNVAESHPSELYYIILVFCLFGFGFSSLIF